MGDSNTPVISSTASTLQDDKWTYIPSGPPLSPTARSATSASTSCLDLDQPRELDTPTAMPSSPARSLVDSEESEPKLDVPGTETVDDTASPVATPLPASPVENDNNLTTPKDRTWARSRTSIALSEGEEEVGNAISGGGAESANVPVDVRGEGHTLVGDLDQTVPALTVTKATMSPGEIASKSSQVPVDAAPQEYEDADEGETTDVPPVVNRIDTKLAPAFVTDADQLYASPTFTNNAAPNSAVSPKTASFFATDGHRSPPRVGGATIIELPSDADTADELRAISSKPSAISMHPSVAEEDEDDEPEKPCSSSKTMPLISPRHSSDAPTPRPSYFGSREHVSTFSRDHSPAPRLRAKHASRSRSRDHRPRHDEKPYSAPRLSSQFHSRTYVSSTRPQARQPFPLEAAGFDKSLSLSDLVDEVKKALSMDSTAYYTLKGVLVEHEELKRQSPSLGNGRDVQKDQASPGCRESKVGVSGVIHKEEEEEDKLTPRRYRHPGKPRRAPVKSFSLTQTDSESEAESTASQRRGDFTLGRAQQGFRGDQPVPLRAPYARPPVPAQSTRPAPRTDLAGPPVASAATGSKSSIFKSLKLVSPGSEAAASKPVSKAATPTLFRGFEGSVPLEQLVRRAKEIGNREAAWKLKHHSEFGGRDSRVTRGQFDEILATPRSSSAFIRHRVPRDLGAVTSALKHRPDLRPAPSPSNVTGMTAVPAPPQSSSPPSSRFRPPHFHFDLDVAALDGKPVLFVNYLGPRRSSAAAAAATERRRPPAAAVAVAGGHPSTRRSKPVPPPPSERDGKRRIVVVDGPPSGDKTHLTGAIDRRRGSDGSDEPKKRKRGGGRRQVEAGSRRTTTTSAALAPGASKARDNSISFDFDDFF